jgi:hypothetical protein
MSFEEDRELSTKGKERNTIKRSISLWSVIGAGNSGIDENRKENVPTLPIDN